MSNAFDVADETLRRVQNGFVSANSSKVYSCYLFKNDYTPHPGTTGGDFIAADFPGAVAVTFAIGDFGLSSVTDHVAMITLNRSLDFTATISGTFAQLIYGYVVVDELNNYAWAERFKDSQTIGTGGKVSITPRLKQGSCPSP